MASPLTGTGNPSAPAFQEAVEAFRARVAVDGATWSGMNAAARSRAFGVAGLAQLSLVTDVWKALEKSVADGETFADFKRRVGTQVKAAWAGTVKNPAHRLETIYRTNLATAYSRGTWAQLQDPLTRKVRPYVLSQVQRDGRNSEICARIGTVVLPGDHPWWLTHWSPLHHRCRRTQSALTEKQAKARGVTALPPAVTPAPGFGAAPGTPGDVWTPDPSDAPAPLQAAFQAKQAAGPPPPSPEERMPYGPVRGDSSDALLKDVPHLVAALGDRMRVDGYTTSPRVHSSVQALAALPDKLLAVARAVTTDIHISGTDTLPNMGRSGVAAKWMAAVKPQKGAGQNWHVASAVHLRGEGISEVLVSKNQGGSVAAVIHELGHAIDLEDRKAWRSKAPGYLTAWEAFRKSGAAMTSMAYFTNDKTGPQEAFAEAFAVLWAAGGRDYGAELVAQKFGQALADYMAREYGWQNYRSDAP